MPDYRYSENAMITYTRHPEHDFTLFVSKGKTTIEEWVDTVGRYSTGGISRLELYDLRTHTNFFSKDEIERLIHHAINNVNIRPEENRTAILVSEAALYGVSRMYEGLAQVSGLEDNETKAFYNLKDAVEWLGEQAKEGLKDYV